MIPKIIHYCWFGDNPKSDSIRACMETWQKVLPDYEIREWSEKDLALFHDNTYVMQAYRARKWAFVSDVFRLHALFAHGGIYLDTDVEVRRSFDPFLKHDFFIGSERCGDSETIGTAVIGAAMGNDIVKRMLDLYRDIPFVLKNDKYDKTPNTVRLRAVFEQLGITKVFTDRDPIKIGEKSVIYPVGYFCLDTPDSYAVHHFAGSWCDAWKRRFYVRLPLWKNTCLTLARFKGKKPCIPFVMPPNTDAVFLDETSKKYKKTLLITEKKDPYCNLRKERFHRAVDKAFTKQCCLTHMIVSLGIRGIKETFRRRAICRQGFGRPDDKAHVLIRLGGGLGDIVIALNYVKHFAASFAPNVTAVLSVPSVFKDEITYLTRDFTEIADIVTHDDEPKRNDLILSLIRVPIVEYAERIKLNRATPALGAYVEKLIAFSQKNGHMLAPSHISDKLLECYTHLQGRSRVFQADIDNLLLLKETFHITPPKNAAAIREKFALPEPYITVQHGVGKTDSRQNVKNRLCPIGIFYDLAASLKKRYPGYTLVQIGDKTNAPVRGVDINLCGQTDFEEMLSVLDGAALHVSCEGGMVHMRHFMGKKPSLVLFGPTDETFYGYPENVNVAARLCHGACEWLTEKWREECLFKKGAACMQGVRAKEIMAALCESGVLK